MKRLAIVKDPAKIARGLAAHGEPTEVPRGSPKRGPPYAKSRVLRRQALANEDACRGRRLTAQASKKGHGGGRDPLQAGTSLLSVSE
jgi:hypothetical protein